MGSTELERPWEILRLHPHPPLLSAYHPPCSYLFLPLFPFTSAFSVLAYMWETDLVLEPPKHSVIKERPRGRMKPSGPAHCHHEPNTILPALLPSLGCPSTRPDTPWGQGLSVINPWISTFYSVMQAENLPGVFAKWLRNGSDVQTQCTSSYLLIAESLLGTGRSQLFQGRVESAPLTLVWRETSFSDLQIVPQLINNGRVPLLNNLTFPSYVLLPLCSEKLLGFGFTFNRFGHLYFQSSDRFSNVSRVRLLTWEMVGQVLMIAGQSCSRIERNKKWQYPILWPESNLTDLLRCLKMTLFCSMWNCSHYVYYSHTK